MSDAANNLFLVIEGLDGSGKTEISRRLKQTLQVTHGTEVELTFEPHDPSAAGLFIRQVLTKRIKDVQDRTLALAFALNRADHNDRIINPFLDAGQQRILLCDRYYLSSLVYQSTPAITMEQVLTLNEGARRPDLTIFLSASAQTCYERMRKRPKDQELFERNLEASRQKYLQAIAFLRQRGEPILEINADGDMQTVLNAILNALTAHGPSWLRVQQPLANFAPDGFSLNGIHDAEAKAAEMAQRLAERWRQGGLLTSDDPLPDSLSRLKDDTEQTVNHLPYDDLALLFIGYLSRLGYTVVDRLPWTETSAYEMQYEMPLSMKQRGTALLLAEAQKYDVITQKIQLLLDQALDFPDINKLSDFMFVLDASSSKPLEKYYETDAAVAKISPAMRIIHRHDIAELIFVDALAILAGNHPDLRHALTDALEQFGLRRYWDTVLSR